MAALSDVQRTSAPFDDAVSAIDAGDLPALRRLLDAHPRLAADRLAVPSDRMRAQLGRALDGFFKEPYLLWFVAEDPERTGRLPGNIAEVIRVIVDAARRHGADSLQEQLDVALRLVAWSGVAARCGVQLTMIDALVDAGAAPGGNANNALVNGHLAAAAHLLARGGTVTLAAALCLERWDDVPRLAAAASPGERQFSLVLAALNGKAAAVRWMLDAGTPANEPSADLYPHGTPLHHAVCSGDLETVRALVAAGADVHRPDTAWQGTPLGWAEYYVESTPVDRRPRYEAIASYLRELESGRSGSG